MNANLFQVISCEIRDEGNGTRESFSPSLFEFPPLLIIPVRYHRCLRCEIALATQYQIIDIQVWGFIYGRHFAGYAAWKLMVNEYM
jgi:hypothetical protein